MGLKKLLSLLVAFLIIAGTLFSASAESLESMDLGRVYVRMPEITVEVSGSGYDKDDITATLGAEKLSVSDLLSDPADISTCAYLLVDISTSMRYSFDLIKSSIVSYIEGLDDDDTVILITFGEVLETVLSGNETREDAINAVKQLKCDAQGTTFYEALKTAYERSTSSSSSDYDREYVIAFSDGKDLQEGNSTVQEVEELYKSHCLPLYGACFGNSIETEHFGILSRSSGGELRLVKSENDFESLINRINDITVVKLKAPNNHSDGTSRTLTVSVVGRQKSIDVLVNKHIEDNEPPTVDKLFYNSELNAFEICFSEEVDGAIEKSAYKIVASNDEILSVSSVFYQNGYYQIVIDGPVYADTYRFEFSGITDASQEKNPLNDIEKLTVDETKYTQEDDSDDIGDEDDSDDEDGLPSWAIILIVIGGIVLVGLVALTLVLSLKGKKTATDAVAEKNYIDIDYESAKQNIEKHHIKADNSARIKLKIKTGKVTEQNIELNVVSSIIVGRSNMCDVYIDDPKLSRQHFAIEHENEAFYITDLKSSNGTMLNGIRINGKRRINSGDKIVAGLSDITITVLSR